MLTLSSTDSAVRDEANPGWFPSISQCPMPTCTIHETIQQIAAAARTCTPQTPQTRTAESERAANGICAPASTKERVAASTSSAIQLCST